MEKLDPDILVIVVAVLTTIAYTLKRLRLLNWTGILRATGDSDMYDTRPIRQECKERIRDNAMRLSTLEADRTKNQTNIENHEKTLDKLDETISDIFDKISEQAATQSRLEAYIGTLLKQAGLA